MSGPRPRVPERTATSQRVLYVSPTYRRATYLTICECQWWCPVTGTATATSATIRVYDCIISGATQCVLDESYN
eukprot:3593205-Pleurochrysis_carterae.AAC.1